MPIHFVCTKCGKKLFAQERYSGRSAACPECRTPNVIPAAGALIDMERGNVSDAASVAPEADASPLPPAPSPARGGGDEARAVGGVVPLSSSAPPPVAVAVAGEGAGGSGEDATKLCPMCGERIKAIAKKCRFCDSLLDEGLRAEAEQAREKIYRDAIERSARTWRMLARVAAGFTIGWLINLLLMIVHQDDASIPAAIFDVLLLGGMFISMRQMKDGPHHVFVAAAFAVTLSMPLLSQMGFQPADAETYRTFEQQFKPMYKDDNIPFPTQEQWNQIFWSFTSMAGLVFSIPVWIAAAKVAALQRLRAQMARRDQRGPQK